MRAIIQRVNSANVTVEGQIISKISNGILVFLGIGEADGEEDIAWLSRKIANLRIFNDGNGVMNRSLLEENGGVIVVSQFTLHASTRKGNRPSYIKAARPELAIPIYERFIQQMEQDLGKKVGTGVFGADMKVSLINDGPVTIQIDTKNKE
ncbi:MAG TPA: D-aminoacyl-tRNA deacylase [Arenibacter sp.]|nr:D-aminoacyl-tRNA deacylase [Arenibacter sp.]